VGKGEIKVGHHGKVMLPSPATLELLKGFRLQHANIPFEMVTPTGAAILSALAERTEEFPALEVQNIGYGAGDYEFKDRPNLLRVTLGSLPSHFKEDRILLLESNLDDMNPLGFELLYKRLFEAGALDVYVTPVVMKKMRPAYKLSVLFEHRLQKAIAKTIFNETPTFGVRFLELSRFILDRKFCTVQTPFGSVTVKTGNLDGRMHIASPEYEDCKRIALRKHRPFRTVYQAAKKMAERMILKPPASR
jgi:uncharacterized protein (DUF111 family)